jgi:hypothetical protein
MGKDRPILALAPLFLAQNYSEGKPTIFCSRPFHPAHLTFKFWLLRFPPSPSCQHTLGRMQLRLTQKRPENPNQTIAFSFKTPFPSSKNDRGTSL